MSCKFWMMIVIGLMASPLATGQQIKVEKVKGNKAVIEFSNVQLSPGRTYSIAGASANGSSHSSDRKYIVGGSLTLQFLTSTTSISSTESKLNLIGLSGRFGWNLETIELGLLAGYTNRETSTSSYAAIAGGAFIDYNFTPNRSGETSVYGVSGEGTYTSITSSSGGSEMGAYLSGFAKWFVFGPSTAVRMDAGYTYGKSNDPAVSTTTQGFAIRGGIATYF